MHGTQLPRARSFIILLLRYIRAVEPHLQAVRWLIAYGITYPFTFAFLCCAKLLVFNRLLEFSKHSSSRLALFARILGGVIVVGSLLGLCGNIAAAVFFFRSAEIRESNSSDAVEANNEAESEMSQGIRLASIQFGSETIMLLLIVIAISVVGVAAVRRVRVTMDSVERTEMRQSMMGIQCVTRGTDARQRAFTSNQSASDGRQLQRQISVTCFMIFISFLMRAVYLNMFTISTALRNNPNDCPKNLSRCSDLDPNDCPKNLSRCSDLNCHNDFYYITLWFLHSPSIYFSMVLISQPVSLLVALWGMTSGRTLQVMRARELEQSKA